MEIAECNQRAQVESARLTAEHLILDNHRVLTVYQEHAFLNLNRPNLKTKRRERIEPKLCHELESARIDNSGILVGA